MQKFNIRWNDIDANRHLANSAFMNFMSQARLNFIKESGIDHKVMAQYNLGPIAFYEHIYYFKEVNPDEPIYLSVELKGMSEEGTFFEFVHNIYDKNGQNMATCDMMGAWMSTKTRGLTQLPADLAPKFKAMKRADDFRILTKRDTRKHGKSPQHIDPIED